MPEADEREKFVFRSFGIQFEFKTASTSLRQLLNLVSFRLKNAETNSIKKLKNQNPNLVKKITNRHLLIKNTYLFSHTHIAQLTQLNKHYKMVILCFSFYTDIKNIR